jgi:hypothetical protein
VSNQRLDRYLRIKWPGHVRVDSNQWQPWAQETANHAFFELAPVIKTVVLRSRNQNWEVLALESLHHHIVADLEFTDTLSRMDMIVQAGQDPPLVMVETLATAWIGWSCLWAGDYAKAYFLLSQIKERQEVLQSFFRACTQREGRSITGLFVLLHEIAHHAVDTNAAILGPWSDIVKGKIVASKQLTLQLIDALENRSQEAVGNIVGYAPSNEVDVKHLTEQLRLYLASIETNSEVHREILCDVVAILALASYRFEHDILRLGPPRFGEGLLRELGDILMIGIRTLKLIQTVGANKSEATVLKEQAKAGHFTTDLTLQTIRQNIMVAVCSSIFDVALDTSHETGTIEAMRRGFPRTVNVYQQRIMQRLTQPAGNVFTFLRDEGSSYKSDLEQLLKRSSAITSPENLQAEAFRLYDQIFEFGVIH